MEEALIRVKDLCKIYNPGENEVRALDHINLEINKGEFVAIIGQSGSGVYIYEYAGLSGCAYIRRIFSEWN
jgi:ABC-type glutathione transport system ATPase component